MMPFGELVMLVMERRITDVRALEYLRLCWRSGSVSRGPVIAQEVRNRQQSTLRKNPRTHQNVVVDMSDAPQRWLIDTSRQRVSSRAMASLRVHCASRLIQQGDEMKRPSPRKRTVQVELNYV